MVHAPLGVYAMTPPLGTTPVRSDGVNSRAVYVTLSCAGSSPKLKPSISLKESKFVERVGKDLRTAQLKTHMTSPPVVLAE